MNAQTLLHRQVHPVWIQDGRVTSQAFKPTPKDEKKLSVYDGVQISPEESWRHLVRVQELKSAGVRSVTVGECAELDLPARSDSEPFPEHAIIDFNSFTSSGQIEKRAKKLNRLAEVRGWLYFAEEAG